MLTRLSFVAKKVTSDNKEKPEREERPWKQSTGTKATNCIDTGKNSGDEKEQSRCCRSFQ